jgi:Fe(3+) dicitrate transport protein
VRKHSVNRLLGQMFVLTPLALAICVSVQAKETEKKQADKKDAIEVVQVVGNWLKDGDERLVRAHAGARNVLRREDIEASGADSVAEAVRQLPGIQVPENNGTGSGDYALNLGLRGLGARLTSQATVLVDGFPLANAPYGQPELSLAPVTLGSVEAVDLVKGGSAVRFGPQNIGGIVNFVTPAIPEELGGKVRLRHSRSLGDGNGNDISGGLAVGASNDAGSGALLMYSGDHGDGYREQQRQDIDNLFLKYQLVTGEGGRLEGNLNYYRAEARLPGPLTGSEYLEAPFQSTHSLERFEGDRKAFNARYTQQLGAMTEFELSAFVSDSFREIQQTDGKLNGADSRRTKFEVLPRDYLVYGVEPRLSQLFFLGDSEHELGAGYRFVSETSNERRYRSSGAAGFDPAGATAKLNRDTKGETQAHALYLDDRIQWGDWDITPGVRLEWVEVSRFNRLNDFEDAVSYSEALPSLAIGYQATQDLRLYANANSSFGAVGFLSLSTEAGSTLEPERARLYELGGRYQGAGKAEGLALDATLFYIDFDNQIQYDATAKKNLNLGASRHQGVELSLGYDFGVLGLDGLSVDAGYAYVDARLDGGEFDGNHLRLYSPHQLSVAGHYKFNDWQLTLQGYGQSAQYADEANTELEDVTGKLGEIPGFAHWNLVLNRALHWGQRDARVSLGVKNLFDKAYFTRASIENNGGIYAGAPRSVYLELSSSF